MSKTHTATVEIHHWQHQPPVHETTANLRLHHKKAVYLGRGHTKLIPDCQTSSSPAREPQTYQSQTNSGPLTIVAENMTDAEVDRVNEDARKSNTEVDIRDNNGKVSQNNSNNPNRGKKKTLKTQN